VDRGLGRLPQPARGAPLRSNALCFVRRWFSSLFVVTSVSPLGFPAEPRKHKFLTAFEKKALYRGPAACYLPQKLAHIVALVFWIKGLVVDIRAVLRVKKARLDTP